MARSRHVDGGGASRRASGWHGRGSAKPQNQLSTRRLPFNLSDRRLTRVEPSYEIGYVDWAENPKWDKLDLLQVCEPKENQCTLRARVGTDEPLLGNRQRHSESICAAIPTRLKAIIA